MDLNASAFFNMTSGIMVKETIGNHMVQIQPGSFCSMDKTFPTNGLHYHSFYELCIVVSGSGEYLHGDERFLLQEGDVFIADPWVKHEIRLLRNGSEDYVDNLYLVFFIINISALGSNQPLPLADYEEKMLNSFMVEHLVQRKACRYLLSYLDFVKSYVTGNQGNVYGLHLMVRNMALESMFCLVETTEKQHMVETRHENSFHLALGYIEANLSRKLQIRDIASYIFNSERNLQYMFRKYMNRTVVDYINDRKMSIASVYLRMKYRVSDVCVLVGVNDPAQFSRLFKKYYGVSPKRYQSTHT